MVLAVLAMLLVAQPAYAQIGPPLPQPQPAPIQVRNEITVQVPPPDPEATAEMAGWSFSGIVVNLIAPTLASWTNAILDVPDFIRETPPDLTYRNGVVRELAGVVRLAALGLLLLAVLAWAVQLVTSGAVEMPGRIVLGVALAAGNLVWWQWSIDINNALCRAIGAPSVASLVRPHLTLPTLTTNPVEAFAPALTVIATAVVCLMLVFAMFMRLATIDVLIVVGSLALFAKAGEGTERFYSTYIGWSAGTLLGQIMVVVTLKLATVLGVVAGGVAGTLLGLGVLLLARHMPAALGGKFSQSHGGGGFLRFALLRRLLTRL